MTKTRLMCKLVMILAVSCLTAAGSAESPRKSPSILFCANMGGGMLHLQYLKELKDKGFEVDFLEEPDAFYKLTPERLAKYNVVFLNITPDAIRVCHENQRSSPELVAKFRDMIEGYLDKGGSVFLMPGEGNLKKQHLSDLTDSWGATPTVEKIVESDARQDQQADQRRVSRATGVHLEHPRLPQSRRASEDFGTPTAWAITRAAQFPWF